MCPENSVHFVQSVRVPIPTGNRRSQLAFVTTDKVPLKTLYSLPMSPRRLAALQKLIGPRGRGPHKLKAQCFLRARARGSTAPGELR